MFIFITLRYYSNALHKIYRDLKMIVFKYRKYQNIYKKE